jgi:hypothetical protein
MIDLFENEVRCCPLCGAMGPSFVQTMSESQAWSRSVAQISEALAEMLDEKLD